MTVLAVVLLFLLFDCSLRARAVLSFPTRRSSDLIGVAPVIEQQYLHIELGRANGGHIAAGAAADNDKIKFLVSHLPFVLASFCQCLFRSCSRLYKSSSMRAGSSSASLTATRNSTAALPSMWRWPSYRASDIL